MPRMAPAMARKRSTSASISTASTRALCLAPAGLNQAAFCRARRCISSNALRARATCARWRESRAPRGAREATLCAMEIVEVAPPYDVSDMTALLATRVIVDVLANLVDAGKLPRSRPAWPNPAPGHERGAV